MEGQTPTAAPGWYADPRQPLAERYWSGSAWSEQTRPSSLPVAAAPGSNGFAVTALVCGLLGFTGLIFPLLGWMIDIAAIVFGAIGRRRAIEDPALGGRGMATAGLVLGIAGLALALLLILFFFFGFSTTY